MQSPSTWQGSAGQQSHALALTGEAALLLAGGPLNSSQLVAQVCRMPGVPAAVADDIAVALLGSSTRFTRNSAGSWSLAELPSHELLGAPHPAAQLKTLRYLVVDVETTGVSPLYGDRITEIAAYSVEGNEINLVLDTLVNPRRPIPSYITSLTGISWAMVRDKPPFEDFSERLVSAMAGHVFVAHNVSFDWRFVCSEINRASGAMAVEDAHSRLCTVKLARALLPGLPRRSLDHVAFHLGVDIESRHRAGGDALATARVLRHLLRRAADAGLSTWGELDLFLQARRKRVGGKRRRARRK